MWAYLFRWIDLNQKVRLGEMSYIKISEILNLFSRQKLTQGIEKDLLKRKQLGTVGKIIGIIGVIHQSLTVVYEKDYFSNIENLIKERKFYELPFHQLMGIAILIIGFCIYFIFKRTKILLKATEEPFRYTFCVGPFQHVKDTEKEKFKIEPDDRFHELLHHDLMEKMKNRIGRLSLVETKDLDDDIKKSLTSHININGHYSIREIKDNIWVIHVMPRIQIGCLNTPATLTNPVQYQLDGYNGEQLNKNDLDANKYNQIVERIYSSIATEIYRQIKLDLSDKIKLFPTSYLRATALYHEAKDFSRSNTIDSYDHAIVLYREALRYFNISPKKWITSLLLKCWGQWRFGVGFQHMLSKVEIEFAKCLIYKRQISALSGRYQSPLFGIRKNLDQVIKRLMETHNRINVKKLKLQIMNNKSLEIDEIKKYEIKKNNQDEIEKKNRLNTSMSYLTVPEDSWRRYILLKPSYALYERQKRLLFDANVVSGLAYNYLGSVRMANKYLLDAKSVAPERSERNPLYLLSSAMIEPDIDKKIPLLIQATEIAPDFEIAQFQLAYYIEMKHRKEDEIKEKARTDNVIKEYNNVLNINPGNIASHASQGYSLWLLGDDKVFKQAKKIFEDGCDIKAIVKDTFVGELKYGLARITAEKGEFDLSYNFFSDVVSSDPSIGASWKTTEKYFTTYFEYIGSNMLERYESYKKTVSDKLNNDKKNKFAPKVKGLVFSYVLNDYGNACYNYFLRYGDFDKLDKAINAYSEAIEKYQRNRIAYFNLYHAYSWRNKGSDRLNGMKCLEKADELGPTWHLVVIELARAQIERMRKKSKEKLQNAKDKLEKAENNQKKLIQLKSKQPAYQRDQGKDTNKSYYPFLTETPKLCDRGESKGNKAGKKKGAFQEKPDDKELPSWQSANRNKFDFMDTRKQPRKRKKMEVPSTKDRKELSDRIMRDIEKAEWLCDNAEKETKKDVKKVLKQVKDIMRRTKLSSIFEGLQSDHNGQGINILLSEKDKIENDRLDEYDVEVLIVWAEVLSCNSGEEASRLCKYILDEYYPEDFDVNLILYNMYDLKQDFDYVKSKTKELKQK